jgi:phosphonoacetaldehyde hydrolase
MVDFGSRAPVEAFRAAFEAERVPISVAEARAPMGLAKRDHIATIIRMPRVHAEWSSVHGSAPGDSDIDRIYHQFLPLQKDFLLQHSRVIDGAVDALAAFRARGLKIGSTTGYVKELMEVLVPDAARQGLHVDAMFCPSDVPAGRPAPFMCWLNAIRLGVYPMWKLVKIGDTIADIEEGLAAGMWTIGITRSGNELGLSPEEASALPSAELAARVAAAGERLRKAGAHHVAASLADTPPILDLIAERVTNRERPV